MSKEIEKEQIPYIETNYSHSWYCPVKGCFARNEVERDGDGFPDLLKCEDCGKEFGDYNHSD